MASPPFFSGSQRARHVGAAPDAGAAGARGASAAAAEATQGPRRGSKKHRGAACVRGAAAPRGWVRALRKQAEPGRKKQQAVCKLQRLFFEELRNGQAEQVTLPLAFRMTRITI